MTKIDCYTELFKLKRSGIDITEQIKSLAGKSAVPESVLEFIRSKSTEPISQFIESLRVSSNRSKNKVYKELMTENNDIDEYIKSLVSYVTRALINTPDTCCNPDDKSDYYKSLDIDNIANSLADYFTTGNVTLVLDEVKKLQDINKSNKSL